MCTGISLCWCTCVHERICLFSRHWCVSVFVNWWTICILVIHFFKFHIVICVFIFCITSCTLFTCRHVSWTMYSPVVNCCYFMKQYYYISVCILLLLYTCWLIWCEQFCYLYNCYADKLSQFFSWFSHCTSYIWYIVYILLLHLSSLIWIWNRVIVLHALKSSISAYVLWCT